MWFRLCLQGLTTPGYRLPPHPGLKTKATDATLEPWKGDSL